MKNHMIIIGGMGPQASLLLHAYLISNKYTDYRHPDEFPLIVHVSIPVPDFISSPKSVATAIEMIENVGQSINTLDAVAIGLACNTAHLLLDQLPSLNTESFVSMIDAVTEEIHASGFKRVGLLASPYTIESRLYHQALSVHNIEVIQPAKRDIDRLGEIIRRVVAGETPSSLRAGLSEIAQKLEKHGVDCILLGCTELPVVGIDSELPIVDSLASLSKAMLAKRSAAK